MTHFESATRKFWAAEKVPEKGAFSKIMSADTAIPTREAGAAITDLLPKPKKPFVDPRSVRSIAAEEDRPFVVPTKRRTMFSHTQHFSNFALSETPSEVVAHAMLESARERAIKAAPPPKKDERPAVLLASGKAPPSAPKDVGETPLAPAGSPPKLRASGAPAGAKPFVPASRKPVHDDIYMTTPLERDEKRRHHANSTREMESDLLKMARERRDFEGRLKEAERAIRETRTKAKECAATVERKGKSLAQMLALVRRLCLVSEQTPIEERYNNAVAASLDQNASSAASVLNVSAETQWLFAELHKIETFLPSWRDMIEARARDVGGAGRFNDDDDDAGRKDDESDSLGTPDGSDDESSDGDVPAPPDSAPPDHAHRATRAPVAAGLDVAGLLAYADDDSDDF